MMLLEGHAKAFFVVVLASVAIPEMALAVEYDCKVEAKLDSEHVYTEKELREGRFSVKIEDDGVTATIARCSFSQSEKTVTCDRYDVDKVAVDKIQKMDGIKPVVGEHLRIKKYYRFTGQLDVQLFPSLSFVENNGRGGIAFGKCRIVSP